MPLPGQQGEEQSLLRLRGDGEPSFPQSSTCTKHQKPGPQQNSTRSAFARNVNATDETQKKSKKLRARTVGSKVTCVNRSLWSPTGNSLCEHVCVCVHACMFGCAEQYLRKDGVTASVLWSSCTLPHPKQSTSGHFFFSAGSEAPLCLRAPQSAAYHGSTH